jgi:hypothetical protein
VKVQELLAKYKAGQRDFRGVDLRGENLAWANLTHIDFRAANLQDVNLSGADLSNANLSESTNLTFANLSRANLSGSDLRGANLTGASLDAAYLENTLHNDQTQFPKGFNFGSFNFSALPSQQHQPLMRNSLEDEGKETKPMLTKISEIERRLLPESKRYGQLLNWQNSSDPFWHYGIGLSDRYIFDTGKGLQPFEKQDAKVVKGIEGIAFSPQQTIDRLKHALLVFDDWTYSVLGWNCEHLARLIVTDQPRSYQCQWTWWLSDLMPNGEHKAARQIFRDHLAKNAPELNR